MSPILATSQFLTAFGTFVKQLIGNQKQGQQWLSSILGTSSNGTRITFSRSSLACRCERGAIERADAEEESPVFVAEEVSDVGFLAPATGNDGLSPAE